MTVLCLKPSLPFQNKESKVSIRIPQSPADVAPALSDCPPVTQACPFCSSPKDFLAILGTKHHLLLMDYMLNSSALPTQALPSIHSDARLI